MCVHNEAGRLADCLDAARFADEIVIALDRCTDESKSIALRYGARIIEGAWPLEGDRRNAALKAATGDWIFELDADERISPSLAQEIRKVIASSSADYHAVPVHNYVGERLVRYGWGSSFGVNAVDRLSRKGVKHWGAQRVHPAVTFHGRPGSRLATPLVHHVDRNVSDMIRRLDSYSTARAMDLVESGKIGSFANNLRRFFSRFLRCYIGRKGYREGALGFLVALCAGLYPLLAYIKARYDYKQT